MVVVVVSTRSKPGAYFAYTRLMYASRGPAESRSAQVAGGPLNWTSRELTRGRLFVDKAERLVN